MSYQAAGVQEGQVLAGKYRIEKVLGVGGMGVVVAARHIQLDTKVAIKFLAPTMLENADAVARFAREARAAVRITGEHVARVLDVGTFETGAPYMVMEFLEGIDLAAWIQERGVLPIDQAVEFVLQACVAVAEAHALGIVHRDLKPANLFVIRRADGKPSVKVLDFGISKMTEPGSPDSGMSVTKTSAVMGSPLYMSPEQMQASKLVDSRTDVWALGVILYELLTGKVPFEGETVTDVAIKVATQPAAPAKTHRADIPAALDGVILKCLEKPKEQRVASVADLAHLLLPFAPERAKPLVERVRDILHVAGPQPVASIPAPTAAVSRAGAGSTGVAVTSTGPGVATRTKRSSVPFFAGAALVAIGLGAVALVLHKGGPGAGPALAAGSVSALGGSPSFANGAAPPPGPGSASDGPSPASPPVEPPPAAPPAAGSQAAPRAAAPAASAYKSAAAAPLFKAGPGKQLAVSAPASGAPAPAHPPSATHKNSLDLGGFQ